MLRKTLLFFVLLIGIVSFSVAQNNLSSYSRYVYHQLKPYWKNPNLEIPEKIVDEYLLFKSSGIENEAFKTEEYYVSGLFLTSAAQESEQLKKLGVRINTVAGNIRSFHLPLRNIDAFVNSPDVKFIEFDSKIEPLLDKVRSETEADKVHQGLDLPQAYKGKNVVVGIIDTGFDSQHVTFSDEKGKSRISRWWIQGQRGTPPKGYTYGKEVIGPDAIIKQRGDGGQIGHGTHVAGIAVGRGNDKNNIYTGIAPEAEIIFVSYNKAESNILDAINYIFEYADSVGKPAVINMSFGIHQGPHDGTGLIDRAFDNMIGEGKILVAAGGNEGKVPMHLKHEFNGDTLKTIPVIPSFGGFGRTSLEIWSEEDVTLRIPLLNSSGKVINYWSKDFSTESASYDSSSLSQGFSSLTVVVATTPKKDNLNGKASMQVVFNNMFYQPTPAMQLFASKGKTHIWNLGFGTEGSAIADTLPGAVKVEGYTTGDYESSLRNIGGVSDAVITVGAYTTKNKYRNAAGKDLDIREAVPVGEIAPFSSHGPTADGRTKPDITAPGNVVCSALSQYDQNTMEEIIVEKGTNAKFGVYEGTSMASPVACGAVALLLQINPKLTTEMCKEILKKTAKKDDFTKPIDDKGSNIWGWGKLNIYGAAKMALTTSTPKIIAKEPEFLLSPNPVKDILSIQYFNFTGSKYNYSIYNVAGQRITSGNISSEIFQINTNEFPGGLYILKIEGNDNVSYSKFIVEK